MVEYGWWSRPDSWHDRAQNQAIDSLSAQLSSQRSRMRRQMQEATQANKKVASDLAGLTRRIEEFMEYTDLRFELLNFEDLREVRAGIEGSFQSLARGRTIDVPELVDVDGYWLPPAAHAALAWLDGRHPSESDLEEARERDRTRTELFLAAVGTGFERPDIAEPSALALLRSGPGPSESDESRPMPHAWNLLWTRAASGEFGQPGREALKNTLSSHVDTTSLDWVSRIRVGGKETAVARLKRLREICEACEAETPERPPAATDIDDWRGFVQELVGEGHDAERRVLDRIREIRAAETGGDGTPAWQRPTTTIAERLMRDVINDDTEPRLRRLAVAVCAKGLTAAADKLRDTAVTNPSTTRVVRRAGVKINVDEHGPDQAELVRATANHEAVCARVRRAGVAAAIVAGALLLAAVAGFVLGQPVIGVIAILGAIVAGIVTFERRANARGVREDERRSWDRLDADIRAARESIDIARQEAIRDTETARAEYTAIAEVLTRVS